MLGFCYIAFWEYYFYLVCFVRCCNTNKAIITNNYYYLFKCIIYYYYFYYSNTEVVQMDNTSIVALHTHIADPTIWPQSWDHSLTEAMWKSFVTFLIYWPCCAVWLMAAAAERASWGMPPPLPGTGGTVAHRLISALLVDTGSLLLGGPPRRLVGPVEIVGVGVATSAGVQFRLVPSFSEEKSSSESSNMRSLRRSGLRGEVGETEFSFLGPGRLRGLDSSPDEPPLDIRDRWGL